MDTYQQVAQRLLDMHRSDQEWMINQLSPHDREQVAMALAALRLGADGHLVPVSQPEAEKAAAETPSAIGIIRGWDARTIATLLSDEPIWLIALALSLLEGEHTENVLANMEPPRAQSARNALQQIERVEHAHIADLVSRSLVEKAERRRITPLSTSEFDKTLRRVERESKQHQNDSTP